MTHDTTGIQAITAERQRQTEKEGWTPEYDDTHTIGQMARAAACYAWAASLRDGSRRFFDDSPSNWWLTAVIKRLWPWDREWWKPKDRRADLVRAGALIAAEIDRLDRLEEGGGS